jgi:hypothetical protein
MGKPESQSLKWATCCDVCHVKLDPLCEKLDPLCVKRLSFALILTLCHGYPVSHMNAVASFAILPSAGVYF